MREEHLSNIAKIIFKSRKEDLQREERNLLESWLSSSEENKAFYNQLKNLEDLKEDFFYLYSKKDISESSWRKLEKKMFYSSRNRILRFKNYIVAASVLIAMFLSYIVIKSQIEKKHAASFQSLNYEPGRNRGILVLSDGERIELDENRKNVIDLSGTNITSENGVLKYPDIKSSSIGVDSNSFNTLIVPKKGMYKVILSDNSKVWLNSDSKLIYPTKFGASSRIVYLQGEAYFEVKSNHLKPFSVVVNDDYKVDALGTSFNVNSYSSNIETTLLKGSVIVKFASDHKTLKPEQKVVLKDKLIISDVEDIGEAFAWKDGLFYFNNKQLDLILQDLSRWYDVTYHIDENIDIRKYSGAISRHVKLDEVLKMLSRASNLQYELNNRVINVYKAK